MSSSRSSLRGGGDILTRRLLSLRADILARGETSYRVLLPASRCIRCRTFREVVVAFSVARALGVSVCHVSTVKTLGGLSVHEKETDWLLFPGSFPVMVPSKPNHVKTSLPRYERSESAERSKRHA